MIYISYMVCELETALKRNLLSGYVAAFYFIII